MQSSLINGRYQIIKTLGQGGFGDTFLVKDTQLPSQRQCVLKALKVQATSPQMVQEIQRRFQREAAILENLGEYNSQIPRLFAYFEEQEKFYLVQEWVDGPTLQEIVQRQGCLSPEQVQKLLVELLPVLQSVHDKYIIHRDIKPENIILRQSDQKPVLIDFGAVKEALTTSIYPDGNAPVSVAIGTPGYMAPEQGTGRPVYSSDLYGLGFTAIYLLTGKSPQNFAADSQTGELIWQQDFPYLDTLLGQAIAKTVKFHPRDRYPTANTMLAELLAGPSVAPTVGSHNPNSTQQTAIPQPSAPTPTPVPAAVPQNMTMATKVIGSPQPLATKSVTEMPVAPTPHQNVGEQKKGGCFKIGCALASFSLVGLAAGLWIAVSILGRSQVQTFPPTNPDEPSSQTEEVDPIAEQPEEPEIPEVEEPEIPEPTEPEEPTPPTPSPSFSFPIIQVGATEADIKDKMAVAPTDRRKGYWPDTIAILYKDYGTGEVSLGYIVDDSSLEVRQTEVTFAVNTELSVIQNTVAALVPETIPPEIFAAIAEVHAGGSDVRSFRTVNYRGQIKRESDNELYLGIWSKDFH